MTYAKLRYVSWQMEAGEAGTPHWQGYAEFTAPQRLAALKKWLPTAHFEVARGSREQARDYTRKPEGRLSGPFEYGDFGAGGQGQRSDLAMAAAHVAENGISGLAEAYPVEFVKYERGLKALARALQPLPRDEDFKPRPWQQRVMDLLSGEPDDRTVYWVCDSVGNRGKSRLARYLCCEMGAIQLTGRIQDMSYAYESQGIVVFNITRAQVEHSDHIYTMAEMLKDGYLFSTKYESCAKRFRPPHVVVFANVFPKEGMWSADRVRVVDLNNPDMHVVG